MDGDVHPVAHTPRGIDPRKAPKQPAWESDQLPTGRWVLGAAYEHHPIDAQRHTFVVCGSPRSDDSRGVVADLHRQVEQGKLRPSRGLARAERPTGRDRPTDRREGGHSSPGYLR
ncbi:MAG: hypothetical protein GEV07_26550 [Streptosporangiales bacterium]|nr:hypothetical protein [Streptosporangiales bacterium]